MTDEFNQAEERSDLFGLSDVTKGARMILQIVRALLGGLPGQMSKADLLRERLLEVELRKALGGSRMLVQRSLEDTVRELLARGRTDHVVVGDKGSGKTAWAWSLGQIMSRIGKLKLIGYGSPGWACDALGAIRVESLEAIPRDSIVVIDEAGLTARRRKQSDAVVLRDLVSLARHRGVSLVWVAQSFASLDREILRGEAVVWLRRMTPWRARWDREEVRKWLEERLLVMAGREWQVNQVIVEIGGWLSVVETPLPEGWTEKVSRMFR